MFDIKLSCFYHLTTYLVIDWHKKLKECCLCFVTVIGGYFFFCYRPTKMKVYFKFIFQDSGREHISNKLLDNMVIWIRLMKFIKYVSDGFLMTIDFNSQNSHHLTWNQVFRD